MTATPLKPVPRRRVALAVVGVIGCEWILFELMRAPYRPPHDMTTLLGTEKYEVLLLMVVIGASRAIGGIWAIRRRSWSKADIGIISSLICVLLLALTRLIIAPSWPVSPWPLILR